MADTADAAPAANGDSLFDGTKTTTTDSRLPDASASLDSVTNGPVAQSVKDHSAKASSELSNLGASRRTPAEPAANGQPLTHYHSFFSELLSWKNPRASAIAYASIVSFILAARYLDVVRWALRLFWMALAFTMRPRRYYMVSRATLDNMIGDVNELVNFFVIEAQRILFAENMGASAAACAGAFIAYHLIKLVSYWGLAIMGTTVAFLVPLVYTTNKELIDHHIKQASEMINAQTAQARSVAQKQASHLTTMGKQYAGDYTGKVQEMLRGRGASSAVQAKPEAAAKGPEFPSPPTEEPHKAAAAESEPEGEVPEDPVGSEKESLVAS